MMPIAMRIIVVFPAPSGPMKPEYFSPLYLQVDAVQGAQRAEIFCDAAV